MSAVLSRASAHGCSHLKRQNLRVGGYTENVLKWFNYPHTWPHHAKLAALGLNWLASLVHSWFVEASPTVEKAVSCYKTDRVIALLLSFRSVQSSLAVHEFRAAGKNVANEATNRCVRTFDAWCHGAQSASEQLQLCELSGPTFGFMQEFSMVGCYTENPEKPQNCQNWGGGRLPGTIR